jgi:translocation and assembly module TamB
MNKDETSSQESKPAGRRIIKTIFKAFLWIIGIPIAIVLIAVIALQFSQVQKYLTQKATVYLSGKIKSKVTLKSIDIAFPKAIRLHGLYIEDQKKDTLLYLGELKIDVNLPALLSHEILVGSISIDKLSAHVSRLLPDTAFNFDYIIRAFASGKKVDISPPDKKPSKPWAISLQELNLKDIYLTYNDSLNGLNTHVRLGMMKAAFNDFDLPKQRIHLSMLQLEHSDVSLLELAHKTKEVAAASSSTWDIGLDKLELVEITGAYANKISGQNLDAHLGMLVVVVKNANLSKQQFDIEQINLAHTQLKYRQDAVVKRETAKPKLSQASTSGSGLELALHSIEMDDNSFSFDDDNKSRLKTGMDFHHLQIKGMAMKAEEIHFNSTSLKGVLASLKMQEKSGLVINSLSTHFNYDSVHAELAELHVETNRSSIHKYVGVKFKSQTEMSNPAKLELRFDFEQSSIALSDVLLFQPALMEQPLFAQNKDRVIYLSCAGDGQLGDLRIQHLLVSTGKSRVSLNGKLKGLPDLKSVYAELDLNELRTGQEDVKNMLPPAMMPSGVCIPDQVSLKATFKGYLKNFDADLMLHTSLGDATASMKMNPEAGNRVQPYVGNVNVDHLELGLLLNQQGLLGSLTLHAGLAGEGLDTSNFCVEVDACVDEAGFKGYVYKNLNVKGSLGKKSFEGTASLDDDNLAFDFAGLVNFDPANPALKFRLDLQGADLDALHLSKEGLRVSALVISDMEGKEGRNMTGNLKVENGLIVKNNVEYPIDSIELKSIYAGDDAHITLRSEILSADFKGKIKVDDLATTLQEHFSSYFSTHTLVAKGKSVKQKFDFDIRLLDAQLLSDVFMPKLKKMEPSWIKGSYNSDEKALDLKMDLPQIVYDGLKIDSVKLKLNANPERLNYSLRMTELSDTTLRIENVFLGGDVAHNTINFQLNTLKDDSIKMLSIAGNLKSTEAGQTLKLDPKLILSNYNWNINPSNYILFANSGMIIHDLEIKRDQESLSVNTDGDSEQAPLAVEFKHFDLTEVFQIFEKDKNLVKGIADGNFKLKRVSNQKAFTADAFIKGLGLMGEPVGDVTVHADNGGAAGKYNLKASVKGNANDLTVNGTYQSGSTDNNLNLIADIHSLNLATLEPFTNGQVSRMSGKVDGKITIRGTTSSPDMAGTLTFRKCGLKPQIIDSYLKIEQSQLTLGAHKIIFKSFEITDSLNHKASIDGYADIQDLHQIKFDLRLRTNDFLALNTGKRGNPLYYGTIYLDSDIHLKGTPDNPVVNMKVKLNKGTTLTYIRPLDQIMKLESAGIIEFNDSVIMRHNIMRRKEKVVLAQSKTRGLDLSSTIEIDRNTQFKVIVDQDAGDSLVVKGSALLNFNMDASGKTSLTGRYKVNDGSYHLALNEFIKKDFRIQSGSVITWSGDVSDAYLDISAIYKVRTSPLDLVQDQVAGMTESQKNMYRTNLDFQVFLKMKGSLENPDISFDIQLPPDERGALNGSVDAKLSQMRDEETEMNKQVFSLIALNKFLAEDPLDNSGGGGDAFSSTARSSASRLLSQQLNKVSGKYVKGVDLNLGVESFEDYSSGQQQGRTQVQLGVSKQILKDKVTVQVGGNVDVEGEKAKQNNASEIAGNIVVEYKLTEDARYKLKGFRKNEYENPLEGELTKTGIGIIFTKDYNKLKELFHRNKKDDSNIE